MNQKVRAWNDWARREIERRKQAEYAGYDIFNPIEVAAVLAKWREELTQPPPSNSLH